jgi:chromosome partitioning protein
MKEAAAALNLPLARTPVTLRQIYADAPGQGALVWKLGARGSDAAAELAALFTELFPDIPVRVPRHQVRTTRIAKARGS